jgi:hypothetical protein
MTLQNQNQILAPTLFPNRRGPSLSSVGGHWAMQICKTSKILIRMSEIKSVSITGGAAADMMGGPKRRRGATKKRQDGGTNEPIHGVSGVMTAVKGVESPSPLAATAAAPNSNTWLKYPAGAPVPPAVTPEPSKIPVLAPVAAQQQQQGGTKHVKVELKKKAVTKKVHLNPKKAHPEHKSSKKHQTKKVRKVTIGVSSLHKRITRAKKVHKVVKDMPIDKLKERLIKGGLIKPTSTAPETVLRQIARDAEIVKNKAL